MRAPAGGAPGRKRLASLGPRAALAVLVVCGVSRAAPAQGDVLRLATVVLYDGSLGGTPDTQGFFYLTNPPSSAQAMQTFDQGVSTLDTTPVMGESAGYFANPAWYAPLDRWSGYQVQFTMQVMTETHASEHRAGFSLLVVGSDRMAIELGFWTNEVWAQEGGTTSLFTHAEGQAFATAAGLITYTLSVFGGAYTLSANNVPLLSGPLRDYTAAATPFPLNPYQTPNLIFLGDDTSSAQARIGLSAASVTPDAGAPVRVYLPLVMKG